MSHRDDLTGSPDPNGARASTGAAASPPPVEPVPVRHIIAWGLWDWGSAAFNAVVTTFVFTIYLTGPAFGPERTVEPELGWALALAGLAIALFAPISGQRADVTGHRKLWLAVNTGLVVTLMLTMFLVQPEPAFLPLGIVLVAVGSVCFEFASVNYNAMLTQVSTPATVGKVSGLGWGMGYVGGIVLLVLLYFGLIQPAVGLFGVTDEHGLDVRVAMLIAGVWFGIFAIPVLVAVPGNAAATPRRDRRRTGILASYAKLGRDIARLWRTQPDTVRFLVASAVYRDGLASAFTFGGILASTVFGFTPGEVIVFAVVSNIVAGASTIAVGILDDRLGARLVILVALAGLIVSGLTMFLFHGGGKPAFWLTGLAISLFVGPAQSASRSFFAPLIPEGHEGELFGLYATTGRAVSFLAPAAFAIAVTIGGAPYFGIIGIVLVVAIGFGLMLRVGRTRSRARRTPSTCE
ncbi:MFS transporter [Agromyces aerolatus]|uniref:MFS transporter n=1 Tax=Agromyces sp. LY-1074 TaxID=3074080 RepID=UPI002865AAB2|nr:MULTISPECIES: MFS transporter [unclassified Agromyces]MDR5700108.1 MFS transporter [Agromyces sp. LY-1074]MDR5706524.1 MFS transporter [Agromyces sp. LY-1358]